MSSRGPCSKPRVITGWVPKCYIAYQNFLPAPIVILDNAVHVIPDLVEFLNQLGSNFTDFYEARKFDWQRLAGARVHTIEGLPAFDYIDKIASTVSGNYLDHNIRVNSVVSSYTLFDGEYSQRFGDLAATLTVTQTSLEFSLVTVNSTTLEVVQVPYIAGLMGNPFTDRKS